MAHMYPSTLLDDHGSSAERLLYNQFREKLSDDFWVLHSVRWLPHNPRAHRAQGEADFVLAHPQHGLLVLEVKGGISITRDAVTQQWEVKDRNYASHVLKKDPFIQASDSAYALLDWLEMAGAVQGKSWLIGYAVAFPEVRESRSLPVPPDQPREILIDLTSQDRLQEKVLNILSYWKQRYPFKSAPGVHGVQRAINLLTPRREFEAPLANIFEHEGQIMKRLTDSQFSILYALQGFRRGVIIGGAGTGKTLLAMEKARTLIQSKFRVLFLCFNKNLRDHVATTFPVPVTPENVLIATYHALTRQLARSADVKIPKESGDFFAHTADTLQAALDSLRRAGKTDELFDAIIVDEGQDFEDEWWIPLSDALRDPQEGVMYVFMDDNQRVYTQISQLPISSEQPPFVLTENCRNTQRIFEALRPYSRVATRELRCNGPMGRPVEQANPQQAANELRRALDNLVLNHQVSPAQIVMLTPSAQENSQWREGQQLGRFVLTWNLRSTAPNAIRVSTIHAFKGLESDVVILTELHRLTPMNSDQLMYTGLSRARNHAIVFGPLPQPQAY